MKVYIAKDENKIVKIQANISADECQFIIINFLDEKCSEQF